MRRLLLLPFVALLPFLLPAQEKPKDLPLKDAILRSFSDLGPDRLNGLQWITGTEQYSFVRENVLMRGGIGKMADLPIVDLAKLNAGQPKEAAMKNVPAITWETADRFRFEHNDRVQVYNVTSGELSERLVLDEKAERSDMDDAGMQMAYTVGEDLYLRSTAQASEMRLTSDGSDGVVNGRSVHREEYGITKGTFWSPTGQKLAFYRMDESAVSPYLLEDISTKPSTFKKIRYPMAGQASHTVTLGIYDLATKSTLFLKTSGATDDYLTNISWDPAGTYVFVIHLNRATDHLSVVQYDATSGKALRTLIEEQDTKWLEPLHPLTFLKKSPSQYIHWSQKDGWMHLYLYDLKAGLIRQLTKGNWVVQRIIEVDEKSGNVFVEGTDLIDPKDPKGAMETHLYRVELANGRTTRLTREPGTHHAQLSSNGRYLIDNWSSTTVPGRIDLRDATKGAVMKTLVTSREPLAGYNTGTIELLSIPGENGDRLNARLIKPKGFDSRGSYPVLIYVYNGPHVQLVTNSYLGGGSLWMMNAAQRGYLVFTVDGHGSENRGRDFEQVIHRQLGVVEVKDQLKSVEYLKSLPYVDATRIAVHGWSFGGHVTTAMLLRSPGTFKVGVAGGPVMDWSMYEVMYTERYMDTPSENPDGYATTANPAKAGELKDRLLVITGDMDDTVLPEHSLTFLKNCVEKGVQVDFFAYPGHGHNVRGKDRLHLYTKVLDYIDSVIQPHP